MDECDGAPPQSLLGRWGGSCAGRGSGRGSGGPGLTRSKWPRAVAVPGHKETWNFLQRRWGEGDAGGRAFPGRAMTRPADRTSEAGLGAGTDKHANKAGRPASRSFQFGEEADAPHCSGPKQEELC